MTPPLNCRLLTIDSTVFGGGTATGELKRTLLGDDPRATVLQLTLAPSGEAMFVEGTQASEGPCLPMRDVAGIAARIEAFAPDLILFRPVGDEDKAPLFDLGVLLIGQLRKPYAIWIMDDWLSRLAHQTPERYVHYGPAMTRLIARASVRLSISPAMSDALEETTGHPFHDIASGVAPSEWPPRRPRQRMGGQPVLLRYAGGLAPDMTLDSVLDVARAVDALNEVMPIAFEIQTQPHWRRAYGARFEGLLGVSVSDASLAYDAYQRWLRQADMVLLAYNFDEETIRYVKLSRANKLPELLASGAAVVAYGPTGINTLDTLDELDFVRRISRREPKMLRQAIIDLASDDDGREAVGAAGRSHALDVFNRDTIKDRLFALLAPFMKERAPADPVEQAALPAEPAAPRISLVVPNYNSEDFIEATIQSILSQKYSNLQLIVVDGASTDGSRQIIERFLDRIDVLIVEPDEGQYDALNKGFGHADGDILGWLNSDDILLPGALRSVARIFADNPHAEWITGRSSYLSEEGRLLRSDPARPWSWLRFVCGDFRYIQQESNFWTRSLWDTAGARLDTSLRLAGDLDLWARFFDHAQLHSVDAFIGAFRQRLAQRSWAERLAYETEALAVLQKKRDALPDAVLATYGDVIPDRGRLAPRMPFAQLPPGWDAADPPRPQMGANQAVIIPKTPPQDPARLGPPMGPGVSFDGDHCLVARNAPDMTAMRLSRLTATFAPRKPYARYDTSDYTATTPPMPFKVGPVSVYELGVAEYGFAIRLEGGKLKRARFVGTRDMRSLALSLEVDERNVRLVVNGDVLLDGVLEAPVEANDRNVRVGGGDLQRFWNGELAELSLVAVDPDTGHAVSWAVEDAMFWTIERDADKIDATLRRSDNDRPSPLTRYKGKHAGERVFVMGSGPSLNKMDLSVLSGETVFSSNSSFLLFDRIDWRPTYYTCVDSRVLTDQGPANARLLPQNPDNQAYFPRHVHLPDGSRQVLNTRRIIPPNQNRYYFNEVFNNRDNLPYSMVSLDIDQRVYMPFTVTCTMLQIALYMGFSEIYLIGCDTNYVVADNVHQEGRRVGGVGLLLESTEDDDPNHFDPRYFGRGKKWHNPMTERMIEHYGYINEVADEIGVKIYNSTVGGKLEVFPRMSFDTLFPGAVLGEANVVAQPKPTPVNAAPRYDVITIDESFENDAFYELERFPGTGVAFRWMGQQEDAVIETGIPAGRQVRVDVHILHVIEPEALERLDIGVGERFADDAETVTHVDDTFTKSVMIDTGEEPSGSNVTIRLRLGHRSDVSANGDDRSLGAAIHKIEIAECV